MANLPRRGITITVDHTSVAPPSPPVAHGKSADAPMPPNRHARCGALVLALLGLPGLGCQSVMHTQHRPPLPRVLGTVTVIPNEFPLRFEDHSFEAHCYNTIGCSVLYNHRYSPKHAPDQVAPAPRHAGYRQDWGFATYIAIPNFPGPARVKWKSLDGVAHDAEVDIGSIFKSGLILHNVPQDEMPVETAATVGGPSIFLEVNDRTISIYMMAMIFLKDTPARKGAFRTDLILAWSHAY